MNKKIKLMTLFATLATVSAEPITNLAQANVTTKQKEDKDKKNNDIQQENLKGGYSLVTGEGLLSKKNDTPYVGYVASNFDDKSVATLDNASYTTIKNSNYLVVPYWNATIKRAHYDAFASYKIDRITNQLTVLNNKMNLGYDVTNKVVLQPQLVGDSLVTFFRDWNSNQPYGIGEWMVGVTNLNTGEATTYSLASATGKSTINDRNNYVMVDNSNSSNPTYYLATYQYESSNNAHIIVSKINNFNPWNASYNMEEINNVNVDGKQGSYDGTVDVMFGNGFATPKHEYKNNANNKNPLFGWTNLFNKNNATSITEGFSTYSNTQGYWLFETDNGLVFANFGDNGDGIANLQMGVINANNEAIPTATYSFSKSDLGYDFYNSSAMSLTFYKGMNNTYYILPNGVKSDTPSFASLADKSKYFAFEFDGNTLTNLNSYENPFTDSHLSYVASTGKDLVTVDMNSETKIVSQQHWRSTESPVLEELIQFLTHNLFFIDLTSYYNSEATAVEKIAIEKMANWLGKDGDFSFAPMTIEEMTVQAHQNLRASVTKAEMDQVIADFKIAQAKVAQPLLNATYEKWITTLEGTVDGHQFGWYNEYSFANMFPAYFLDDYAHGFTYNMNDNDLNNPHVGLTNLINVFHQKLSSGTPVRMILDYLNPAAGSDIEKALNEYKTWGENQLNYYFQEIVVQFNSFYYGFADTNPENNVLWNHFLNQYTWNPLTDVKQLMSWWAQIMQDSQYDGSSVINFLITSKVWADLSIDSIAGLDAYKLKFPFKYTPEFEKFKNINQETTSKAIDNFYHTFLQKQYLGYTDPKGIFDLNRYFTGTPSQIISETEFKQLFKHEASTYAYLSEIYVWTANDDSYKFEYSAAFNDFVSYQKTSLQQDFQTIIDSIGNSYFGYQGLSGKLTKYLFSGLKAGEALDASSLAEYFMNNTPEVTPDFFNGNFSTKYIMSFFNSDGEGSLSAWKNDQVNLLSADIQSIISKVNENYFGYISSYYVKDTKIAKLLVHFTEGTELTATGVIATIQKDSLPTGLSNISEVAAFIQGIDSNDVNVFILAESNDALGPFMTIVDLVMPYYYGYTQTSSMANNPVANFIIGPHEIGSQLIAHDLWDAFKNAILSSKEGYPKAYTVSSFLNNILQLKDDINAYISDQAAQLTGNFETVLSWLAPYYFGFMGTTENNITKYIFMDQSNGIKLDPIALSQNFINHFPTGDKNFEGKWSIGKFFSEMVKGDYSHEINEFIDANQITFNLLIEDLYTKFLSDQYVYNGRGSSIPGFSPQDFYYYSNQPIEQGWSTRLITKDEFIVRFSHDENTYIYFARLYDFKQNDTHYDISRNDIFNRFLTWDYEWTISTFVRFIESIQPYYYGFASLPNNLITRFPFFHLKPGESLDATKLAKEYLDNPPPYDNYWCEGKYSLDSIVSHLSDEIGFFKSIRDEWIQDQLNQLKTGVTTLVEWVAPYYYGFTSVFPANDPLIGRMFSHYTNGLQLDVDAIVSSINANNLPYGLTGLNQVAELLNACLAQKDENITSYANAQKAAVRISYFEILDQIKLNYYGYAPSSALSNNIIAKILLPEQQPGTNFDLEKLWNRLLQGITNSEAGYPQGYNVFNFMNNLMTNKEQINEYVQDQKNQLINRFAEIIKWIEPDYYGFMGLEENNFTKYIFMNQSNGTMLEPEALATYFMEYFPTGDKNFEGKWSVAEFFNNMTQENQADAIKDFNTVNNSTFNKLIDDLYDSFLSQQYYGYVNQSGILDVSEFFTGSLPQIISKPNAKLLFAHDGTTAYSLMQFYDLTKGDESYNFERSADFLNFVNSQASSLKSDFDKIINNIGSIYYGYSSLANNKITTYLLPNLKSGQALDSSELASNFMNNHPAFSPDFFAGMYGSKALIDWLISNVSGDLTNWENDQKTQLKKQLDEIFSFITPNVEYYGLITKENGSGLTISDIDKILVNYGAGQPIVVDGIISTFSTTQYPTGLKGLYQLSDFLKNVNQKQIDTFLENQQVYLKNELSRIMDIISNSYLGYDVNYGYYNLLGKTILYNHSIGTELNIDDLVKNFKDGIDNGIENFPVKYGVVAFLSHFKTDSKDVLDFKYNQEYQLWDKFKEIVSWIQPYFLGYNKDSWRDENVISRYILAGYGYLRTMSEQLYPEELATAFIDEYYPKNDHNFPGRWAVKAYFDSIKQDNADIKQFNEWQFASLASDFDTIFPKIQGYWYGYTADLTSVLGKALFFGAKNGPDFTGKEYLLNNFYANVRKAVTPDGVPSSWHVFHFMDDLINNPDASKQWYDLQTEQRKLLETDLTAVSNTYNAIYHGHTPYDAMPVLFKYYLLEPGQTKLKPVHEMADALINNFRVYQIWTVVHGTSEYDIPYQLNWIIQHELPS